MVREFASLLAYLANDAATKPLLAHCGTLRVRSRTVKQTDVERAAPMPSWRLGFGGWPTAALAGPALAALLCVACGASTAEPRTEDNDEPEPNVMAGDNTLSDATTEDSDSSSLDPTETSEAPTSTSSPEPTTTPSVEEPATNMGVERCVAVTPPVPEVPPVSEPPSDADWQNAIVARESDFNAVGGPWQFLRLDTLRVLAINAAGEFGLLYFADAARRDSSVEFGTAAQVCFIDQATAQGLEVRDITLGAALVCRDQRCEVMALSSKGLLLAEANPIEVEDEGWRQLFTDTSEGTSLANNTEVIHFANAEDGLPRMGKRVPLSTYLPSVAAACDGYTTPYLHGSVWTDSTSLTVFGLNDAGTFLYAPFPEGDPEQPYAPAPRCSPLPANLNVIDGQRDAFAEGAHILHSFFLFLTPNEVRGVVSQRIAR
jgi:hypothetical protein